MDKSKLIESLKWRMEMFAHDMDDIEEARKEGGIGNRYLSGQLVAYTEAYEYLEGLAEDIENGEYDKTGHWIATEDGFECSECGCISRSRADFCQYCEAKMVEPQESDDK